MYIKAAIKSLLALILILSAISSFNTPAIKAASTKTGWVSISDGTLNVRSGPSTKSKVIGSLNNNASVTVYSQSKDGWSQIEFKKTKGYVSSKYLRVYSYLMDKTKVYTFKSNGKTLKASYTGKYEGWDEWSDNDGTYLVREDSTGLHYGIPDSRAYLDISYPLKVGKSWESDDEFNTSKIKAINGTLKTQAGTFKNVVTVKTSYGATQYFAPNVGVIKVVYQGKTTYELISLVKKK